MNKIEKLIEDLCPEGVPSDTFDNLGTIYNGLSGKSKEDFSLGNSPYVSYLNIGNHPRLPEVIESKVRILNGEKQNSVQKGDLLFTGSSEDIEGVGLTSEVQHTPSETTYLNSFCFGWRPTKGNFHSGFLKHLFRSEHLRSKIIACSNGVTRINISKKLLLRIEIPLPPLLVQQEIVSILDKYTELEVELGAELGAELQARFSQLRTLRESLISRAQNRFISARLGDVTTIMSGWGFPHETQGKPGDIPFYKVSDMNSPGNEIFMSSSNNCVTPDVLKKLGAKLAPSGAIVFPKIGAAVATNKRRILTRDSSFDNNVMALVAGDTIHPGFLFHWFQTMDLTDLARQSGAVPSIRKSDVEMITIPVPPIKEQAQIAKYLDSLQTVFGNFEGIIPSEITARRQQYEYYRNKLLTFKELKAS
jgi:type I restriction enzyme S subunit